MNAKKRARYLYEKYADMWHASTEDRKQCCRVAVEELINMAKIYDNHNVKTDRRIFTSLAVLYWEEVMSEIDKL